MKIIKYLEINGFKSLNFCPIYQKTYGVKKIKIDLYPNSVYIIKTLSTKTGKVLNENTITGDKNLIDYLKLNFNTL